MHALVLCVITWWWPWGGAAGAGATREERPSTLALAGEMDLWTCSMSEWAWNGSDQVDLDIQEARHFSQQARENIRMYWRLRLAARWKWWPSLEVGDRLTAACEYACDVVDSNKPPAEKIKLLCALKGPEEEAQKLYSQLDQLEAKVSGRIWYREPDPRDLPVEPRPAIW